MKLFTRVTVVSLIALCVVGQAVATTTDITAIPTTPGQGAAIPVGVSGDSAPGWASGSWQAPGTTKVEFYMTPTELFGHAVSIGDVASISYWTKVGNSTAQPDWYVQMYTNPYTGGEASWYGNRINAEPYFSANLSAPANTWDQFSSASGSNQLRFYDSNPGGVGYYGDYTDGFLSDLTSNATYANQSIKYFVMATGSDWASGFTGQLDGLTITLNNGDVANVNFEATAPVPEPLSMFAVAAGLSSLGVWIRKKSKAVAVV